jgi:hypothetical protein
VEVVQEFDTLLLRRPPEARECSLGSCNGATSVVLIAELTWAMTVLLLGLIISMTSRP